MKCSIMLHFICVFTFLQMYSFGGFLKYKGLKGMATLKARESKIQNLLKYAICHKPNQNPVSNTKVIAI